MATAEMTAEPMAVVKVSARRTVAQALEALGLSEVDNFVAEEIIGLRLQQIAKDLDNVADRDGLPRTGYLERLLSRLSGCLDAIKLLEAGENEAAA
jgi:hypothetical protein